MEIITRKKLRLFSKGKKIMGKNQVKNFIMYYERLTKHMMKNFIQYADIVINIDKTHRLKSVRFFK